MDLPEFIENFNKAEKHKDLSVIEKDGSNFKVKCNICGNTFTRSKNYFIDRGRGCPFCNRAFRSTTDEFKRKVKSLVGDEYTVLGEYINNKRKINMKHNLCGNIYAVQPNKFLTGRRCPKCSHGSIRKTQEEFNKEVQSLVGDEYTVLGPYQTNTTKITMKHNLCGNIYDVEPVGFLTGRRCPKCSHGSIRKTQEEVKEEISLIDDNYEILSTYQSRKKAVLLRHKPCGCEFKVFIRNFLKKGTRCPKCKNYSISKGELELRKYISSIYTGEVYHNYKLCSSKNEKEMDIYIPDKKIGIEYDGLYWHSTSKAEKFNIKEKTEYFNKKGIRIIHIFEDEWLEKQDIVKEKLKAILAVKTETIYARKCTASEVSPKDANEFLNKYHIQGCGSATYKCGLYYEDELVAVMTFVKPRNITKQKIDTGRYELFRYATKYHLPGGFSKLLKYAINKYNMKSIITFADLRWSDLSSNVYIKNGFVLGHISEPNYWYFKQSKRIHRAAFMKYKLKTKLKKFYDDNLTEKEIMEAAGYKYVYDCGNAVLVYSIE